MRGRYAVAVALVLSATGKTFADESPLLGKALPEIELSKAIQGEPWSFKGLLGKVVVLDVFQLG
jgi:hypothetical protein